MSSYNENTKSKNMVVYIVFILFVLSLFLMISGLVFKKRDEVQITDKKTEPEYVQDEDVSINKYFESTDLQERGEIVLQEDPFRNECDPTSGDNKPSVSSNIVCLR